jgi:hypothetical protein
MSILHKELLRSIRGGQWDVAAWHSVSFEQPQKGLKTMKARTNLKAGVTSGGDRPSGAVS